ncbi:MAG TPA: GntR family transcriptional regulator [Burkholderiaceae bacterium]|nr:GntR family transcriptional regulator [Burkholderiaceae bacterium]
MLGQIDPSPDLAEQVYEALLEGICSGRLAPGERFTQEALAARLGVSRQPVLQALLLLRRQGLFVDTENRRGVRVAPLDAAFVGSLYAVRAALDGLAGRCAASRPRPELLAAGSDIVRRGRRAAEQGERQALVALDLEFHQFLYEASGNPLLLDTAQLHWHHTRRVMAAYLSRPSSVRNVWNEHDAILQAIVAGDAAAAERLSREHCEQSGRMLQQAVRSAADAPARPDAPPPQRRHRS